MSRDFTLCGHRYSLTQRKGYYIDKEKVYELKKEDKFIQLLNARNYKECQALAEELILQDGEFRNGTFKI